jgi:ribose transport system permease protein
VLTKGDSVTNLPGYYRWFNDGVFAAIPVPIWTTIAAFVVTWVLLYSTKFGRYVFAIGGNRRALILSGTRVKLYHVAVYVYAGLLVGVASFIMTARMNAAHPTIGVGLEFDAIAAVILGGTSFEKGRGGITGTVVGALAVGVLRNGLNLIGISTEWQVAIVGIVIIFAVGFDSVRRLNA